MNSNTLRARLAFSFKGETYALDTRVDLDRFLAGTGEAPNFHHLLATAGGIDPYSYLYEVLESHEIEFFDPTGLATHSCRDGCFDWSQFAQHCREERDLQRVRVIAAQALGVDDLDGRADLKAALLAAYRAGRTDGAA